jgi:hypothetical protein
MRSTKIPVFRKPIIPWYRSKTAYVLSLVVMLFVLLFGVVGISISREVDRYHAYTWFPALLAGLSLILIVILVWRYLKQHPGKSSR